MPFGTLLFLVLIIALLLFTNSREDAPVTRTGAPVDMSSVPYFLRYNAPSRNPRGYHVAPQAEVSVATAPAAAVSAANVFAGMANRII